MEELLNRTYWGNTLSGYLVSAAIFAAGIIIITILRKIVLKRLSKWSESTETKLDDFIIKGIEKAVIPVLYLAALKLALEPLKIDPSVQKVISVIFVIIVTFLIIKAITSSLKYMLNSLVRRRSPEGDAERRLKQIRGITAIASFLVWTLGFIFLLDNLGFEISAVIAGLGIGGIAIALAAQTILGDLFSYFVIFFDRPFEIGDFIAVGDKLGTVEYIGIKTTRLRSLSGEQLVFSNTDLTNSRIQNYKKMERRRIVFKIGIVYDTPPEKLAEIPGLIRKIIEEQSPVTFDRAHFASYGDFSLNYEFVYYVEDPDYNKYMDIQQAINLKINDLFISRGIRFAYPTRTVFLSKENGEMEMREGTKKSEVRS
jgi:small-conductance mechanosensitive channel